LSAEAADHLLEKQVAAYSVLIDTAEEKGGNITDLGSCLLYASDSKFST